MIQLINKFSTTISENKKGPEALFYRHADRKISTKNSPTGDAKGTTIIEEQ